MKVPAITTCTQAALFGTAAINIATLITRRENTTRYISNALAGVVGIISGIHYTYILKADGLAKDLLYADWLVTVPLLIAEMWLLLDMPHTAMNAGGLIVSIILSVLMIVFGFGNYKVPAWGCLAVIYVLFATSYEASKHRRREPRSYPPALVWIFFGSWVLYGVVDLVRGGYSAGAKLQSYAFLDMFSKALFGLTVALYPYCT